MVHSGMWKKSEEKSTMDGGPNHSSDPSVDVKKKEKPKMVGVLEVVRY